MENKVPITGECLCGGITYRVDGKLQEGKSCHCSRCRKAFSSQASSSALVEPADFKWLTGGRQLTSYIGEHGFGYQFCKVCGSTLCTVYKGQVFQLSLGCINGDPDVEIGKHIYIGSKAKWEVIPDNVTQFEEDEP
jgi:hypothetical protein